MAGFRIGPEFGRVVRSKRLRLGGDPSLPDRSRMSLFGYVGMGLTGLAVLGIAAFLVLSVMRGEGLRPYPITRPGLWTFPIVGFTALIPLSLVAAAVALIAFARYAKRRRRL